MSGAEANWPEPPDKMISTCDIHQDSIRVIIPASGLNSRVAWLMVSMISMVLFGFLSHTGNPVWTKERLFYIMVGLVGLLMSAALINHVIHRTTVDASPAGLRVTFRGVWTKVQEIAADELQSLEIERSETTKTTEKEEKKTAVAPAKKKYRCLVARSDEVAIRFAEALKDEEMEWLRGAILYVVTGEA